MRYLKFCALAVVTASVVCFGAFKVYSGMKIPEKSVSLIHNYAYPVDTTQIGDISSIASAIFSGKAKVIFVGDSITEGVSQVSYDKSWASKVSRLMEAARPEVEFTFENLSLPGLGIGNFSNDGFVAGEKDFDRGFFRKAHQGSRELWPNGSTAGKSWMDHVKAANPDLIIVAFGMNDFGGGPRDIYALTSQVLDKFSSLKKRPSIVLVSPMLPTTSLPVFLAAQAGVQTTADVYCSLAQQYNLTLIDANWRYLMLRDAVDNRSPTKQQFGMRNFPEGFNVSADSLFRKGGDILYGTGTATQVVAGRDVEITAKVLINNFAEQSVSIWYRVVGDSQKTSYRVQLALGHKVILYHGLTPVATATIPAIASGSPASIKIKATGAHHQVFIDDVPVIDEWDYRSFARGAVAIQVDDGPEAGILSFGTTVFEPLKRDLPVLSEATLLGASDAPASGGNGINHPSILGHEIIYTEAALPFIEAVRSLAHGQTIQF